jgi:hypothetical protein
MLQVLQGNGLRRSIHGNIQESQVNSNSNSNSYENKIKNLQNKIKNCIFSLFLALDAAAPYFESYPGSFLTFEDADFVDTIHTSAGNNIVMGQVGFIRPYGHVDFYPNGGEHQPRCAWSFSITCNHRSSLVYFEATITAKNICTFAGFKCESWEKFNSSGCKNIKADSKMGFESTQSGHGTHYLQVTKDYPFCVDKHHG